MPCSLLLSHAFSFFSHPRFVLVPPSPTRVSPHPRHQHTPDANPQRHPTLTSGSAPAASSTSQHVSSPCSAATCPCPCHTHPLSRPFRSLFNLTTCLKPVDTTHAPLSRSRSGTKTTENSPNGSYQLPPPGLVMLVSVWVRAAESRECSRACADAAAASLASAHAHANKHAVGIDAVAAAEQRGVHDALRRG